MEKKLTDEEIIKELINESNRGEWCELNFIDCVEVKVLKNAIDLIHRLQDEIKGYKGIEKRAGELLDENLKFKQVYAEQKAEIERLTEENAILKENPPILVGRSLGKTIRAKLLAFDEMKEQNDKLQKQVDELMQANIDLWNANQCGVKFAKNPYKGEEVE